MKLKALFQKTMTISWSTIGPPGEMKHVFLFLGKRVVFPPKEVPTTIFLYAGTVGLQDVYNHRENDIVP